MKLLRIIIIGALVGVAIFFAGRGCANRMHTTTRVDTLVVRDTIRDTVLVPVARWMVRVDTLRVSDTLSVEIPIERKTYQTDDYKATVEGFRPALVEMEVYRNTVYIERETTLAPRPKRWGVGVQAGYGVTVSGGRVVGAPYIGVGVSYNIFSF